MVFSLKLPLLSLSAPHKLLVPRGYMLYRNKEMKKITQIIIAIGVAGAGLAAFATVAPVSALECSVLPQSICDQADKDNPTSNITDSGVWGLLLLTVRVMVVGAGIAAVGGIVYGAVMYTTAGGNQEQVKKARGIITNVVIGVIAFAAMFALLEWLLPGGAL